MQEANTEKNADKTEYFVTGIMSGTSLDGLDMLHCCLTFENLKWSYRILHAETAEYPATWQQLLANADQLNGFDLICLHKDYGRWTGDMVYDFHHRNHLKPQLIAMHGHTVFHQPSRQITFQLGDPAVVAAINKIPVVGDFRSVDVALGGQGAPLVPLGDALLFPAYDSCLNLGGFANISFHGDQLIAYDICPVNIVINHLCRQIGRELDLFGNLAKAGKKCTLLFEQLNSLAFYSQPAPKSLGKEWVEKNVLPLMTQSGCTIEDQLNTFYHHVAWQIAQNTRTLGVNKTLVTGGGTHNSFLTSLLNQYSHTTFDIPDPLTVNFKEALIFALLGLLRFRGENNCIASVTGAAQDHRGGCIYRP